MSKRANPTAVGAFTAGALVILVVVILVFGSDRFLKKTTDCVVHFDGAVTGLDIGAPVVFRGVKVGAVKAITLVYDDQQGDFHIPVIVEIYSGTAVRAGGGPLVEGVSIEALVAKGLRAQLVSQSLLTGKLSIALEFHEQTQPRLVADSTGLAQIPTIPTTLDAFSSKLEALPLEEIVQDLRTAMQGISDLANAADIRSLLKNLNATVASAQKTLESINAQVAPASANLIETSNAARESLAAATDVLRRLEAAIGGDSAVYQQVIRLIESTSGAAQSIEALTRTIDQQPESILRGKRQKERYE